MRLGHLIGIVLLALGLAGCSKFKHYDGPEVTQLIVVKSERRMYLMHGDQVLEAYDVFLGYAPDGPKQVEGDGKTPEGTYVIDRRNPNSNFHLSLGLSYPNDDDRARALALGQSPGGDIFIHGQKSRFSRNRRDWTAGCISVSNKEMEQIYAMVRTGTPITILP